MCLLLQSVIIDKSNMSINTVTNDDLPGTPLSGDLIGSPGLTQADPPHYEDNHPGDLVAALLCLVLVPPPIPVTQI